MNKSRLRIAQVYSELERRLKSSVKKEEALKQMRGRNQDEEYEEYGDFEIPLYPISEKIKTFELLSRTEDTNVK